MIILAVLAAAVIPRVVNRTEQSKYTRAQVDIESIKGALDTYRADNGVYPTTEQGLEALRTPPTSEPVPRHWSGPYSKSNFIDPWGNPYQYLSPGENDPDFDVWSMGEDGQTGGEGRGVDITSWDTQRSQQ